MTCTTTGRPLAHARRPWPRWPRAMLLLLLLLAGCSKVELYGSLSEREANEMLALLMRSGIGVEKVVGKGGVSSILVDGGRIPAAVEILNAAGLPRDKFANIGDLFRKEGLISSPSEERVRYMYGITQELSRTLTGIDGVLSARVHVVLPANDPVGQPARPSSAAVLIRYAPGANIDAVVPKIKELVVNSIEGMSYDRVSVVLVRAADDLASVPALPAAEAGFPPMLSYALFGALALALVGNAALGVLLWRRRTRRAAAPALTQATS